MLGEVLRQTLLGRRLRPADVVTGLVAVAGVALIVLRPDARFDPVGIVAAVAANCSFATGVVLTKRFPPTGDRITATGWQLLAGGSVLVPSRRVAPPGNATGGAVAP